MQNGIGKRIDECLEKLKEDDGESAFIQLSIAIEGTSKLTYPNISGSAKRNRLFIKDSMPFVFWCLTNGAPFSPKNFIFEMENGKKFKWEEVMYNLLRCSLMHEAEMPNLVTFTRYNCIANCNGKIVLPLAIIEAYCWAVIANPVNKNAHLERNYALLPYGTTATYSLNDCWGNEKRLREIIKIGFLCDVEKMFQELSK